MGLYLFTQMQQVQDYFRGIKGFTFEVHPCDEMKKIMRNAAKGSIAYYDISGLHSCSHPPLYKAMLAMDSISWGIIDPLGCDADPSMLMHSGFIDYIGKDLLNTVFSSKRFYLINEASHKKTGYSLENTEDDLPFIFKPSGMNWQNIHPGTEYSFCFLFIELDNTKVVHRSQFDAGADINPSEIFKRYVESRAELYGGKVWMWMDTLGMILFPFEDRNCQAVYAGIRLMMDRMIFCIDESISSELFSFRIALHAGNIEFKKRGETGEIVSDVINTVFHLGQKFTDFGDYSLSREALSFAQPGYLKLFLYEGKYEGMQIYRLRRKNKS